MKPDKKPTAVSENQSLKTDKVIDNHKSIAKQLEEAAKKHYEAVKHHEEENHEEAHNCTLHAHKHLALATEAQTEMLKHFMFTS